MKTTLPAAFLVLAAVAPLAAGTADDDLQAVKRAVASSRVAEARPPAEDPAPPVARSADRGGEPRWLRVRVVEKAGKRARVSVNLPLGLARALGGEWPIGAREGRGARTTLGEVLRALDSGQSLVEIEDDEASVRVWVD